MASKQEIRRIKEKAVKGLSVNQIKEELSLPKSTVYYHFKKEVGQKQKENALSIPDDDEFKGELCGIFAGDGSYYYEKENYKYRIVFTLNINQLYWERLRDLFEEKLGKKPHVNKQPHANRVRLRYESKVLYSFLSESLDWETDKSESIRLKDNKNFSKEFKIGFIRGLIDTDGHKIQEYRCYKVGTISKPLMNQVSRILDEFNIKNTLSCVPDKRDNCRDMYRIRIYGDYAERLGVKIRPRHPKKQF